MERDRNVTAFDTFAKLFNTGYRKIMSSGDEYRSVDLDRRVPEARKIIIDNGLPLRIVQNNDLTQCRAFMVKEDV